MSGVTHPNLIKEELNPDKFTYELKEFDLNFGIEKLKYTVEV